jgi:hypothetical protein
MSLHGNDTAPVYRPSVRHPVVPRSGSFDRQNYTTVTSRKRVLSLWKTHDTNSSETCNTTTLLTPVFRAASPSRKISSVYRVTLEVYPIRIHSKGKR